MRIRTPRERWFTFENDPDNGKILIRQLTPGERQDIFDQAIKQEIIYKPGKSGESEPMVRQRNDMKLDRELTFKSAIIDWKNFYDEKGKPIKCTNGNIIKAIRSIDGLSETVKGFMADLDGILAKEDEDQEKNLPNT